MDINVIDHLGEIKFKSLVDYLYENRAAREKKPAIIVNDRSISFADFITYVEKYASVLESIGVRADSTVALMLPNVLEFCVIYYAMLRQGIRIIPINIILSPDDLRFVLEDSQAEVIIAWSGFTEQVKQAAEGIYTCKKQIYLDTSQPGQEMSFLKRASEYGAPPAPATLQSDDDALVFYTAGISDTSRGAVLTHKSISTTVYNIWETFLFTEADRTLAALPLFHPFGQMLTLNVPLAAGGSIVLLSKIDINEILMTIDKYRITCLVAVPSVFDDIAHASPPKEQLESIRLCIAVGSLLMDETFEFFLNTYQLTILEGYGVTECSPLVSCSRIYRQRRRGSVGLPLPDIEAAVFDGADREAPPGKIGEIRIRSQTLMRGYLNQNNTFTSDGWFSTGDIGRMDLDGYLYLIDRKNDMITKDGFFVSPAEIEKVLSSHPKVQLTAVIGLSDKTHGEIIRAFVVPHLGDSLDIDEVKQLCHDRLPAYKVPDIIEIVADLPKTATGKVLKRRLRKQ